MWVPTGMDRTAARLDRSRVALVGEASAPTWRCSRWLTTVTACSAQCSVRAARFGTGHSPAIRRPLLLVQGLDSPGAPAYELEQLRVRLRAEGVDAQTLEAPGEGLDSPTNATATPIRLSRPTSLHCYSLTGSRYAG